MSAASISAIPTRAGSGSAYVQGNMPLQKCVSIVARWKFYRSQLEECRQHHSSFQSLANFVECIGDEQQQHLAVHLQRGDPH
jgi:hypothetical protein